GGEVRKIDRARQGEAPRHAAEIGLLDLEQMPDRIDLRAHRDAVDDQRRIARAVSGGEDDDAARDAEDPRRTGLVWRIKLSKEADAARPGSRVDRYLQLPRRRIPTQIQLRFVDVDAAIRIA